MRQETTMFGEFPRTQSVWILVNQLKDDQHARQAMEELLRKYRPPLKAHLMLRKRMSSEDADDLLQDFMADKVLRLKLIEQADLSKGRFRSFLLTALDRCLIDRLRKRKEPTVDLDAVAEPAEAEEEDASAFNVAWAGEVIAAAAERMRAECETSDRPEVWGIFQDRFYNPILRQTEPATYEELVTRFALKSPAQASNLLITAKRMFQRAMEAVVADYESSDAEIREEIQTLRAILARAGAG